MEKIDFTPSFLKSIVSYDPISGRFFWKERPVAMFNNAGSAFVWNADNAGAEIFLRPKDKGYCKQVLFGNSVSAHRAAFAIMTGVWPEGPIDHLNGVKCDNRFCNLRIADHALNARNRAMASNNTSGFTGVQKAPSGRWIAVLQNKHLGTFDTREDASIAYEDAKTKAVGFTLRHGLPKIKEISFGGKRYRCKEVRAMLSGNVI